MKKKLSLLLLSVAALLVAVAAGPVYSGNHGGGSHPVVPPTGYPDGQIVPGKFIILVQDGHDPVTVATDNGVTPGQLFRTAVNGFSTAANDDKLGRLRADERVLVVENERLWRLDGHCVSPNQCLPKGIDRIETDKNPHGDIDSTDDVRVNIHVAIIDSGIDSHDDLYIAGGMNFSGGPKRRYGDNAGHGTHVAGTVGALDNDFGVVGVAPGANLWAVKVCKSLCSLSAMIAGVDWVAAQKAQYNSDPNTGINFAVATMSISHQRQDTACDAPNNTALHQAFCGMMSTGVVATLSAGNNGNLDPDYREAIQVAALADFDGKGGGDATSAECSIGSEGDDTLADFSTFGADIAAPGWCIFSTYKDGGLAWMSGTSMAAPHAAGAVALYLHANKDTLAPATNAAGVATIRQAIIDSALPEGISETNPCSYNNEKGTDEPMLFVNGSAFGGDGSCYVAGGGGGGNTAPTAADVAMGTVQEDSTNNAWTPSDSDPDSGDTLTCTADATSANGGTVTVNSNCSSGTYDPAADFNGTDTFSYTVSDGSLSDSGTVTYTVTALNDSPVADDQSVTVVKGTTVTIDLTGSDVDGCYTTTFTFNVTSGSLSGTNGSITCTSGALAGSVDYTAPGSTGSDSFDFTISDGAATSDPARVSITVSEPSSGMHVGDLDGATANGSGPTWEAIITISMHDGSHNGVEVATVTIMWSGTKGYAGGSAQCATNSSGVCSVNTGDEIPKNNGSVTFIVGSVTHATLNYDDAANDVGNTITIFKP